MTVDSLGTLLGFADQQRAASQFGVEVGSTTVAKWATVDADVATRLSGHPSNLTRDRVTKLLQNDPSDESFLITVTAWGSQNRVLERPRYVKEALAGHRAAIRRIRLRDEPLPRGDADLDDPFARAFSRLWDLQWRPALKGFGTAFGTKLLFWSAKLANVPQPPLIYDARVHAALVHLEVPGLPPPVPWDHPWSCVRLCCYAKYCHWAHDAAVWLSQNVPDLPGFSGEDVEYWLFQLGGRREVLKAPRSTGCGQPSHRVDPHEIGESSSGAATDHDYARLLRAIRDRDLETLLG